MFFELPTGGSYKPNVDNLKLVKATVEGDLMSILEIAECEDCTCGKFSVGDYNF
jgi:hypothetical protein